MILNWNYLMHIKSVGLREAIWSSWFTLLLSTTIYTVYNQLCYSSIHIAIGGCDFMHASSITRYSCIMQELLDFDLPKFTDNLILKTCVEII